VSDIVISAHSIGKQYQIGVDRKRHPTLRDSVADLMKAPFRRRGGARPKEESFWALKDVSFEVRQGDVVGVVGRNGAGKSTLLKVLSRITEPSEGYADISGRIGSLLEVGTGFHPELTGRENVYLNGAILGMRKQEITRKFDEIVAFAEIEKFLDTPVKRYSTGMYMRLAFAVAANLNPEILLVDEVLAVGDAAFQQKCLGKMGSVARQGRTVMFVSHNMSAVQSLCARCLYFEAGRLKVAGSVQEGVRAYHQSFSGEPPAISSTAEVAIGNLRLNGQVIPQIRSDEPTRVEFDVRFRVACSGFRVFVILDTAQGTRVLHLVADDRKLRRIDGPGFYRVKLMIPPTNLVSGAYSIHAKVIGNGVGLSGRYFSDNILVMIDSVYDPEAALGVLSPAVEWSAEPIRRGESAVTDECALPVESDGVPYA
jgi:lipopolysaccharide transport system ATP-binding protein